MHIEVLAPINMHLFTQRAWAPEDVGQRHASGTPRKILMSTVAFLNQIINNGIAHTCCFPSLSHFPPVVQRVHFDFRSILVFIKCEQICRDRKSISKPTQLYLASITTEADTQILMVPVKQKLNFTKKN